MGVAAVLPAGLLTATESMDPGPVLNCVGVPVKVTTSESPVTVTAKVARLGANVPSRE